MDRETFARHFAAACAGAREFAGRFLVEALPAGLRFRVRLNCSYDEHPRVDDEEVFPEDGAFARALGLHDVDEATVVAELWREGKVPEWIDVGVIGVRPGATLLEVRCCGRFSGLERRLYHVSGGFAPFHVVSPTLPVGHVAGEKFSIFRRGECWTAEELGYVARRASEVWALTLAGPVFDDAMMMRLPALPGLEVLELREVPLRGAGLAGLVRAPRLRVLRIASAGVERFELAARPRLRGLEVLRVTGLAGGLAGVERLAKFGGLTELWLGTTGRLEVDAPLPKLPRLRRCSLRAAALSEGVLPRARGLESLAIHVAGASDATVARMLAEHPRLKALHLEGTPVTDALLAELWRCPRLDYLDVDGTGVSATGRAWLAKARPGVRTSMRPV